MTRNCNLLMQSIFDASAVALACAPPALAQSRGEWSEMSIGFAERLGFEKRLDQPPAYAVTNAKAHSVPDLREAGSASVRWFYDSKRILQELGINNPSKETTEMATKLGGILTMEAIIRTIERFGSKELSPEVKSFFQHSPDVARPYPMADWQRTR